MNDKNAEHNGGCMAFPIQESDLPASLTAEPGLTKREYFAAMAMQGLIAGARVPWPQPSDGSLIAQRSIIFADELLAELAK